MKSFIYLLIFYQDTGFISNGNFYVKSNFKNLIIILFSNKINKFEKILCLRNIIFKILSYLYIPIGLILKITKFKIYATTSNSIGSYFEQLEIAIVKNQKIIIISPSSWCVNPYIEDTFFKKKFIFIKNNLICFLLIPLTFLKFLRLSFFDDKKNYINQKQYFQNSTKNELQFEHEIIFNYSCQKNKEILRESEIDEKEILSFLNSKTNINLNKKLCIIHLRDEKNDRIRNTEIKNYIDGVRYLVQNNFEVLIFSNQKTDFDNESVKYFRINEENKKIQVYSLILCDIYLGTISGPFHIAKYLNKDLIITDSVIFNHYIHHNNFNIIYKKFFRNNKIMTFKEIFQNNLECIWDIKILEKKDIEIKNNSKDEILNSIIELNESKKINTINLNNLKKIKNEKRIIKNTKYLMMRNTSKYFLNKNLVNDEGKY